MRFIREMIARKNNPTGGLDKKPSPASDLGVDSAKSSVSSSFDNDELVLKNPIEKADLGLAEQNPSHLAPPESEAPSAPKDIWDIDLDEDDDLSPTTSGSPMSQDNGDALAMVAVPDPTPARARPRSNRVKTRLLGFEHSDGSSDVFQEAPKNDKAPTVKDPVGWLVVTQGPGRGNAFTLLTGMSQIGRGDDQQIQLNFGDATISRENHASIAYDPASHDFFLGHGGKSNLVRLNSKPVLSTEKLSSDDEIRIGETTLRFIELCNKEFNWTQSEDETDETDDSQDEGGADDVAIA